MLLKKNWKRDPLCCFCNGQETIPRLFFDCIAARYVWGIIGTVLGVRCRPTTFTQYLEWSGRYVPGGRKIHVIGLSAICWAMWELRNKACFEGKNMIRSPAEIICYACSFLKFWAGIQKEDVKVTVEAGAETPQVHAEMGDGGAEGRAMLLLTEGEHPVDGEGNTADAVLEE